nr:MAG TPA: Major capsid protein [Microviridae sp.]
MASVFNKIGDVRNDVKRNSFDWSHDNNFTTDLGRITPVFTELVPPNSSIRIKPEFGLRFMPMMFPIQTKMKAYLSFYKVPLRTLWKDYMDFISSDNTEEYQPPYMNFSADDYNEGGALSPSGLGDYFGIPTNQQVSGTPIGNFAPQFSLSNFDVDGHVLRINSNGSLNDAGVLSDGKLKDGLTVSGVCNNGLTDLAFVPLVSEYTGKSEPYSGQTVFLNFTFWLELRTDNNPALELYKKCFGFEFISSIDIPPTTSSGQAPIDRVYLSPAQVVIRQSPTDKSMTRITARVRIKGYINASGNISSKLYLAVRQASQFWNSVSNHTLKFNNVNFSDFTVTNYYAGVTPYYGVGSTDRKAIKISAYPFRAYEAVYNAYIRNTRNNPFILNGKKTYNRFITNDAGGADSLTPKSLFYANWQSDAYTSALTAPQQGIAPLVGLTTYETKSINEAGHEVTVVNTAIVDEDGNAFKVDFESNGEALKGVNYTPLKTGEALNMQSLVSPVTSGISINDFRNVNAYQRYLELNQFRGFSYKEIIEGRFDVNVRYDALNMPEYLGGITRDIVVNPITQTVETSNTGAYVGALGSQAGLATCFGSSDGSISVFCDEESVVIGVMHVIPMPVYDSLLPKWLTYRERLDSFNPEFDHIGYQPIYVRELAAVQARQFNVDPMAVFGYQRPWYEYVQKPDRAHGLFLSSLRNFIMYRSFANVPELGKDFTTMKPGDVNNVFSVVEVGDKILGQIHFDCTAQLPISRVVVPRLE